MKNALKYIVVIILAIGCYWIGSNTLAGFGTSPEEEAYAEGYAEFYDALKRAERHSEDLFGNPDGLAGDHERRWQLIWDDANDAYDTLMDLPVVDGRWPDSHAEALDEMNLIDELLKSSHEDVVERDMYGMGRGFGKLGSPERYEYINDKFHEYIGNIPEQPVFDD